MALALTCAPMVTACVELDFSERVSQLEYCDAGNCPEETKEDAAGAELRGYVTTDWAPTSGIWDYNRCVPDPIGQIEGLRQRGDVMGFRMGASFPDPQDEDEHWQGIVRLPVLDSRYLAVSANFDDKSRFAVVELESRNATGERFRGNRMSPGNQDWDVIPESGDRIVHEQGVNSTYVHAGGMQALGQYLFVPVEAGTGNARLYNYDMDDPEDPDNLWGFVVDGDDAGAVAIARLEDDGNDEQYILIVAEYNSENFQVYLSTPGVSITSSSVFGTWGNYEYRVDIGPETKFQHISLITRCEDGQLFLVGTEGDGDDEVHLYEISIIDEVATFDFITKTDLECDPGPGILQCDFKAAGGTYVDPDGRLLLYGTEHDNDGPPLSQDPPANGPTGSVKMMEFRSTDHLDDPDTWDETTEGCPTFDKAFVELYDDDLNGDNGVTSELPTDQLSLMIDFPDRDERWPGFETAAELDDDIQAIRYCIPDGFKYRMFEPGVPGVYTGPYVTFEGDDGTGGTGAVSNGETKGYSWTSTKSWSWGCFMDTDSSECFSPCAAFSSGEQVFTPTMVGCAGSEPEGDMADLCGDGWEPCSASDWVNDRGGQEPTYNYWTADDLRYGGTSSACWVDSSAGTTCSSPMRVCASDQPDPEGNNCNWTDCGYGENQSTPNEYFGGCSGNTTAGTLCCPE